MEGPGNSKVRTPRDGVHGRAETLEERADAGRVYANENEHDEHDQRN